MSFTIYIKMQVEAVFSLGYVFSKNYVDTWGIKPYKAN